MTFDELPDAVSAVLADVRALREQVATLALKLEAQTSRETYDYDALKGLGYSQHEAYAILRGHGFKGNGRRRVTAEGVREYQEENRV